MPNNPGTVHEEQRAGRIAAPETDGRLAVRISVPALLPGWAWKESVTLVHPEGKANVIASSEPLPDDLDALGYAQAQGEVLRHDMPGYEEYAFEPRTVFGSMEGYVRTFEWTPEGHDAVSQIQLYATRAGRGFTATATTSTFSLEEMEATMIDVLDSLMTIDVPG